MYSSSEISRDQRLTSSERAANTGAPRSISDFGMVVWKDPRGLSGSPSEQPVSTRAASRTPPTLPRKRRLEVPPRVPSEGMFRRIWKGDLAPREDAMAADDMRWCFGPQAIAPEAPVPTDRDAAMDPRYETSDELGEQLIFLVSIPRSGSTLLQLLLAKHSEIHTVPEPWILLHPLYGLRARGLSVEYGSEPSTHALRRFLENAGGEEVYHAAVRKAASHLYREVLAGSYKTMLLDKTPRYHLILNEIKRVFPRSHLIVLLRNPLAILFSFRDYMGGGSWLRVWSSGSQLLDLLSGPLSLAAAIKDGSADAVVRYEDLVSNANKTLRQIVPALGLEMEQGMLSYDPLLTKDEKLGDHRTIFDHSEPVSDYRDRWLSGIGSSLDTAVAHMYLDRLGKDTLTTLGYPEEKLRASLAAAPPPGRLRRLLADRLIPHDPRARTFLRLVRSAGYVTGRFRGGG